jgi:ubiquinone/menaquinone biosynthesis C-methylase UbiE
MALEETLMLAHLPSVDQRLMLDLACGTGRYTKLLTDRGASVISLDHSFDMLARDTIPCAAQADMLALPLPSNTLDGIVSGLAIGHVRDLSQAIREIGRVLRPDGFALLTDLHPALKNQGATRTFTAPDGKTYAIEHYWHTEAEYQQAAQNTGLTLITQHSAALPEHPNAPLVWLLHLQKEG